MRALYSLIVFLMLFFNVEIIASPNNPEAGKQPVSFSALYIGDLVSCFHGGNRNGFTYLGLVDLSAEIHTAELGFWKGGDLMINFQNTHNTVSCNDLVGDLQVFDNIENGKYTYLYQLWYRQQFGKFWVLGGLHDMNSTFLTSDYTGDFLNSSFGIMPVTSLNTPVSIFPKTALSLNSGYMGELLSIRFGIYEGDPGNLDEDPHNLDLSMETHNGLFYIAEADINQSLFNRCKGVYKFGVTYNSGDQISYSDSSYRFESNYNVYMIADQELYRENPDDEQGLGLFFQMGLAPQDRNLNDFFMALGLRYTGILPTRNDDIFCLGMAHASISNPYNAAHNNTLLLSETAIELSYKAFIGKHLFIQPDFQYIMNPGINPMVKNAGVAILRLGIQY